MDPTLASKFQLVRVRIEADLKRPSVILVTSARPKDGKSLASYGLAQCLAEVGHSVVLVDAGIKPAGQAENSTGIPMRTLFATASLPVESSVPASSRAAIVAFAAQMRSRYDYAVVDAAPLMHNSCAMLLAGVVDAVLLAVRRGRTPSEDDESMVQTLKHIKSKVLGVIASSAEAIADFDKLRRAKDSEAHVVAIETNVEDAPNAALFAR